MANVANASEHERELARRIRLLEADNEFQRQQLKTLEKERLELKEKKQNLEDEKRALEDENEDLEQEKKALEQENKELKTQLARACKTSRNSSKRPSSDIVKPRAKRAAGERKIGGQPGHPMHERTPFTPEEIDRRVYYALNCCPDCHGALRPCEGMLPVVVQQVELVQEPVQKSEHNALWYWCEKCQKRHCSLPPEVDKGGLCGPVLTAWIAYLKGGCHASFDTIRKFVRDVLGVRICRGQLAKVIAKVSAALADPWEEIRQLLPLLELLNVDETGHRENGRRMWTWCYRAREYILFKITQTRGTAELLEMLGADFAGVIGCDFFSSYRCYMENFGGVLQFCLAHFIREVKFLLELPDPLTQRYGQRLLESLRQLFSLIHQRQQWSAAEFQARLKAQRREILRVAGERVPANREARKLAERLRRYGKSYFLFITTPGLDPTNNIVEQAIRFVVIDRLVTQGTRSEKGRRWCERIWTVIATCTQQGRSAFHFIRNAVEAYFNATPAPSLRLAPS